MGETFSSLHWEISIVILVSAYVIGSVFFVKTQKCQMQKVPCMCG
jgi:hypothetical protein